MILHAAAVLIAAHHPPEVPDALRREPGELAAVYGAGSYAAILVDNATVEAFDRAFSLIASGRVFKVLATFLLGLWVWRKGIVQRLAEHQDALRRLLGATLFLGVVGSAGLAVTIKTGAYESLQPIGILRPLFYSFGVPALAIAGASAFSLLWQMPGGRRVLSVLAPAGRMSLTNYIGQTLAGVLLFYGYGCGLYGRVGLATCLLLNRRPRFGNG